MSLDTLEILLLEQVQDVYYAEQQLLKALTKMANAANTTSLKAAFTDHLAATEQPVTRLDQVFEALDVSAKAKRCSAIEGLLQVATEMSEETGEPSVMDAGLIATAERMEHDEIAAHTAMS